MPTTITFRRGTAAPTSGSGITLGEPAFDSSLKRLYIGQGTGVTAVWVGAQISSLSSDIAAGLTYQVPTLSAVKDYVASTTSGVSSFNGFTGAVQGVSAAVAGTGISVSGATGSVTITNIGVQSFNGKTGAVTGASLGSNVFTGIQYFSAGFSASAGVTFTTDINVSTIRVGVGKNGNSTNTAIGAGALNGSVSATSNVAVGWNALNTTLNNTNNVAVGSGALAGDENGTVGNYNTAVGSGALTLYNTNGGNNTSVGSAALGVLASGTKNIALGTDAGKLQSSGANLTSATGGVYIGYDARGNTGGQTNEIVIGTESRGLGSNTAVIGATTQSSATIYGLVNATNGVSAGGVSTFNSGVTMASTLDVTGNVRLNGNVTLGDASGDTITSTGILTVSNGLTASTLDVTGLAKFNGNVTVGDAAGDVLTVTSGATFGSTTDHTGAARFASTVTATGAVTANGGLTASTLDVSGAARLASNLAVTGVLTQTGGATFGSTTDHTGAARFASTVTATGAVTANGGLTASSVNVSGTLATTGDVTVGATLSVTGNLVVNGTTTTINSTTLVVDDKNIVLADGNTLDTGADGGGITLKGATDKTLNWVDSSDSWTSSEHLDLAAGKVYKIGTTTVLSSSALGSGVTGSSLTQVGTITSGTWQGTAVGVTYGGTGLTSYTIGDVIYASNTGSLSKLNTTTAGYLLSANGAGAAPEYKQLLIKDADTNTIASSASGSGTLTLTIQNATTSLKGIAKFDSTNFTVSSGNVTVTGIDGGTF